MLAPVVVLPRSLTSRSQHEASVGGFWPRARGNSQQLSQPQSVPESDDDSSATDVPPSPSGALAVTGRQARADASGRVTQEDEYELDTINAATPCMPALLQCIDYIHEKCAAGAQPLLACVCVSVCLCVCVCVRVRQAAFLTYMVVVV